MILPEEAAVHPGSDRRVIEIDPCRAGQSVQWKDLKKRETCMVQQREKYWTEPKRFADKQCEDWHAVKMVRWYENEDTMRFRGLKALLKARPPSNLFTEYGSSILGSDVNVLRLIEITLHVLTRSF